MNDGIWKIGEARLCVSCQVSMEAEYVMRCMGEMRRDRCDRCGQFASIHDITLHNMVCQGAGTCELSQQRKMQHPIRMLHCFGTPGETRTHYLALRRRTLYPGELRRHT